MQKRRNVVCMYGIILQTKGTDIQTRIYVLQVITIIGLPSQRYNIITSEAVQANTLSSVLLRGYALTATAQASVLSSSLT